MNRHKILLSISLVFILLMLIIASCSEHALKGNPSEQPSSAVENLSFVEEFDSVGNLTLKGWIFQNNTNPVG
ncbi:MAG: hypothetical protein ABIO76_06475 [Ginsengibacter sp.]